MNLKEVFMSILPGTNGILKLNNSRSFKSFSFSNGLLAIGTDQPTPILYNFKNGILKAFQLSPEAKATPISICISPNNELIATGNHDGSISVWSIRNCTLMKNIVGLHNYAITAISFTPNSRKIIASDYSGLTSYTSVAKPSKTSVLSKDTVPVKVIIKSDDKSPFPISILLYDSKFTIIDLKISSSPKVATTVTLGTKQFPQILLRNNQSNFDLFCFYHNSFLRFIVSSPDKCHRMNDVELFTDNLIIKKVLPFNQELFLAITTNYQMRFLNVKPLIMSSLSGDPIERKQLVNRKQTPLTESALKLSSYLFTYEEHLYILNHKNIIDTKFSAWNYRIMNEVETDDFDIAFDSLIKSYNKLSYDVIGFTQKGSHFLFDVKKTGSEVLKRYMDKIINVEDETEFKSKLQFAILNSDKLDLLDYLCTDILMMIEEKHKELEFFETLFTNTKAQVAYYLKPELLKKILDIYKRENKLKEVEEYLLTLNIPSEYLIENSQISYSYELYKLFGKLLMDKEDFITPANVYWEKHPEYYVDYMVKAFQRASTIKQKYLSIWLLTPLQSKVFKRLVDLIKLDPIKTTEILMIIFSLCPIMFSTKANSIITHTTFVDTIFISLQDFLFEKCSPILNFVCPLFSNSLADLTPPCIRLTLQWVFQSNGYSSQRIKVLNMITKEYPNIIPKNKLDEYCLSAGFLPWILNKYLESKSYDKIIEAMLIDEEYSNELFIFIEEHINDINEIKTAVTKNIIPMLLINNLKTLQIINEYMKDIHESLISILPNERIMYLYLDALYEIDPNSIVNIDLYFKLLCMFEPQNALNFLQDHLTEININEAKVICKKYNNGDCLIHIARHLGDIDSAISAIENILLDFIEMDNNDFECTSEGDLTRFPQLKNSIQAIDIGVSFLKETHTLKLFRIFTFPLYHSRTKHKNIHQTLTVLYTHFIIQSLKFIEANELLPIVVRHIRTFSNEEASLVMKQILFELEYKKNLSDSVNEMCVNDCIALINKAFEHNSTGIASNATDLYCSSCYQPIEKSTVEFLIFPCGHMFHQQVECCNSDDKCPICFKQGMGTGLAPSDEAPPQKLSKRRIQQLLRRIDFSLKKNYGSYTKMCQPSLCISRNALAVGDEKIVFGEPNMPVKILTPKIESE